MTQARRGSTVAMALIAAACSADHAREASFAVTDSAGVEVVTTSSPMWGDAGAPWRLTLETEIGELEGAEPYLFGDPVSAVRLEDGRVAVADAQSADVRFFDANGDFLRRVGTRGEGPGEFESFLWLARCGEGLVAYDWQQRRATPIAPAGGPGDPFPVETPEEGRPPYGVRCLPDGSFLAVGWGELRRVPEGEQYLFYRQVADVWRLFPPGDSTITIGAYISSERLARAGGSGPHPFSRSVVFTGSEDHLFIGGAERLQIEVRSLDGELLRIYRGPDADLVIDDDFVSTYRGAELAPTDSTTRRRIEDAEYPMPETYPAYTDVQVDPLGFVWVERFLLPWQSDRRWGVFDPHGVFLGHLGVPDQLEVTDVGADHIVGVARDELGVPRIRVYRLERVAAE